MTNIIFDLTADSIADKSTCKGRIYRYIESAFIGKNARIVISKELRLMKSLSCCGCEQCGDEEDGVREGLGIEGGGFLVFDPKLRSNDLAQLVVSIDSRDFETGYPDDWHYEAVRCSQEQN